MGALAGVKTYTNPNTGHAEKAIIVAPIVRMYDYATRSGKDGYRCLGVVGNRAHLTTNYPGDHTWFSTHTTITKPGGATVRPKRGYIYAGDFYVPDLQRFEKWLLARLRAGVYVDVVKYFNALHRHWNRRAIKAGKMFAWSVYSGDHHLHLSVMPGAELSAADIFADYEHYRSSGKNVLRPAAGTPAARTPATPKGRMSPLPTLRRNTRKASSANRTLQRALVKVGHPVGKAGADGWFGAGTDNAVKAFQRKHRLTADGIVGAVTWTALVQALLAKAGQYKGKVDGKWSGQVSAAAVEFQKARKLTADGIVGPVTLTALLK